MLLIPVNQEPPKGVINIDELLAKIPRPERSGFVSIAFWLIMILTLAMPVGYGEESLFCTLFWCFGNNVHAETNEEVKRDYNWIHISPFPGGKHICGCHTDVQFISIDGRTSGIETVFITHETWRGVLACNDSNKPGDWPKSYEWEMKTDNIKEYYDNFSHYNIVDFHYKERLHCEGGDERSKEVSKTPVSKVHSGQSP
jgi:hypothetical protein